MPCSIVGLSGVVPPVVTPLTAGFATDYPACARVIKNLIDGGLHWLFFPSSTNEVIFHDEATRRAIMEHAAQITAGRVPVLAGAGECRSRAGSACWVVTDRLLGAYLTPQLRQGCSRIQCRAISMRGAIQTRSKPRT